MTTPAAASTWPSNEIERLFEAAVKDVSARPKLEREILTTELFFIVDGENLPQGQVTLSAGASVGIRMTKDRDGTTALPAFTSLPLVHAAVQGEPVSHGSMTGADLFTMTRGTRILVNPFGPYGKQFFPEEIERLLAGGSSTSDAAQHVDVPAGTQVLLGQLAHKPEDLMKAVAEALAKEPTVAAAYLAAMAMPGPDPAHSAPHPIIGIECSGDYEGVRTRLGPALSAWAAKTGRVVDLFNIAEASGITEHLRGSHKFYPAKSSWLGRMMGG